MIPDERPARRSIRLKEYDYAQEGAYFITVCAHDKKCLFGKIVDYEMCSNHLGRLVESCWDAIPDHFAHVSLGEFVIMPNHFHGIMILENDSSRSKAVERFGRPVKGSIPTIVRSLKGAVTRKWNRQNGALKQQVWQRNYYERVIRNQDEYEQIAEYIVDNPMRWAEDVLHIS